ncbi:hypothetical protein J6590_088301 [Homalodisca vitripennis]|nr:hypothetical protein J6590_088301 [Homalodisca vitripennis]
MYIVPKKIITIDTTTFQRMSTTEAGDGRHSDMETKMTNPAPTTEAGDGRHSDMETKMTNPAPTTEAGDGPHSAMETEIFNRVLRQRPGTSINWDTISYRELQTMARSSSITIPSKLNKNLLKSLVKAENEGHNEYLKLLVNEVINKQSRLKRLREKKD